MVYATLTDQVVVLLFMALLLWAAGSDYRHFIIPNRVSLGILILYPAHVLASPVPVFWPLAVAMATLVFLIGCGFFALKAMGGGDVKLLAVCLMWAGHEHFLAFFTVTVVVGFILAAIAAARTAMAEARATSGPSLAAAVAAMRYVPITKLTIPYGVAVASGGLYVGGRLLGL